MLTTLLLTDVVGSTDRVAAIGDQAWRALLDRHDDAVRQSTGAVLRPPRETHR